MPPSRSVAVTGLPMSWVPVVFSAKLRVVRVPSLKVGAWLALVVASTDSDQGLSPSSLRASTCTW